jgi:hypothetical protein
VDVATTAVAGTLVDVATAVIVETGVAWPTVAVIIAVLVAVAVPGVAVVVAVLVGTVAVAVGVLGTWPCATGLPGIVSAASATSVPAERALSIARRLKSNGIRLIPFQLGGPQLRVRPRWPFPCNAPGNERVNAGHEVAFR